MATILRPGRTTRRSPLLARPRLLPRRGITLQQEYTRRVAAGMPPPATLDELVGLIRRAGAADDAAVDQFAAGRPADDVGSAEAAAASMVRDGVLTRFQALRLLRGETRGFRIADRYRLLDRLGG